MPQGCTTSNGPSRAPIFILGILPRCGTNYLLDLLTLHPDCVAAEPMREDFLLYHADRLVEYAETVYGAWNPRWGATESDRERMLAGLGAGLCRFLTEGREGKRVVTKTPRTENLDLFFRIFPEASLIVLVRDGRSVVESGIASFGWHRESAIRAWARSADRIDAFERTHRGQGYRYVLVRYEDLWTDLEAQMRRILGTVGLDEARYDFAAAADLPLRGSSTLRQAGGELHWRPVEKPPAFDPMSRFRHWSPLRHHRFNRLAGRQLERFGYQPLRAPVNGLVAFSVSAILDAWWLAVRLLGPIYLKLRGRKRAR
ncbi:MAG: sulfotransferase [Planctomycetota bacterium]|nr:MAG: sulfotransferase [Planctomycetota bacterium]